VVTRTSCTTNCAIQIRYFFRELSLLKCTAARRASPAAHHRETQACGPETRVKMTPRAKKRPKLKNGMACQKKTISPKTALEKSQFGLPWPVLVPAL
jgi:hypothetical protein